MIARRVLAFGLFLVSLCAAAFSADAYGKPDIIYQLPPTMQPENQYLRSNGQLLVTCLNCNKLSQIDPSLGPSQERRTVYTFPGVLNVLGIDELSPDVFAVAVGNLKILNATTLSNGISSDDGGGYLRSLISGPTGVYIIDLRDYQAPMYDSSRVRARKVGGSNLGAFFDGLTVINAEKGLLAVTDFFESNIWLVDIKRGTTTVLVEKLLLPSQNGKPSSLVFANGIRYRNGKLYFTASQTGTYAFVPIDQRTGKTTGPVKVIYNYGFTIDDFTFGPTGNAYFTTLSKPNGGVMKRAAGTAIGQFGTTMPVHYFGTNSIIARKAKGGGCELIMTVVLRFQVVKTTISGPC